MVERNFIWLSCGEPPGRATPTDDHWRVPCSEQCGHGVALVFYAGNRTRNMGVVEVV